MFNFGQTTTPAQQPQSSTGFNFNIGQPTTSQPSFGSAFGLSTGLPAAQSTNTGSLFNQPLSLTQTSAPQSQPAANISIGLGGEGATNQATNVDSKLPKDTQVLPPEIASLVEALKTFVATQKSLCDKNSLPKYSVQPILDINSEIDDNFKVALQRLDVTLEKNKTAADLLRRETNVLVSDAENAFRSIKSLGISNNPGSYSFVQSQTSSPIRTSAYFDRLIHQFEQQMDVYAKQIKELEAHVNNMNKPHLPHEVILIVKKQHETLVALAAEIYALHEHVSELDKKQPGKFSVGGESTTRGTRPKSFVGPNPFALGSSSTSSPAQQGPQQIDQGSSLFRTNPSLSNFSFGSPSNVTSPPRAKRFTAS